MEMAPESELPMKAKRNMKLSQADGDEDQRERGYVFHRRYIDDIVHEPKAFSRLRTVSTTDQKVMVDDNERVEQVANQQNSITLRLARQVVLTAMNNLIRLEENRSTEC
jgi:hypothetical protein